MLWKPAWDLTRQRLLRWWNHKGLAVGLPAPRSTPVEPIPEPAKPDDIATRWLDPAYRVSEAEWKMSRTAFLCEAFPCFSAMIGPGSLGMMLGSQPHFDERTVWYEPCIDNPGRHGPIRLTRTGNRWLDAHLALVDAGLRRAKGRYGVGICDLIENIDTLAAMRGNETLLFDLIERPAWVVESVEQINRAFFEAFDLLYDRVKAPDGSQIFSAFDLWGPGRTAKLQCDFSCMISPRMFAEFVLPALTRQCEWLDFSMYHLDGTNATQHLDALLSIEALDAIEWTPQAGLPGGGSPRWFEMYRRIRSAGKSLQVVNIKWDEVVPLLDAIGPEGVYVLTSAPDQATGERLAAQLQPYY